MFVDVSAHYVWWVLALLLIGGEVMMPGYFLLWIGIAAGVMGVVMLALPQLGMLPQALLFAALAFVSCFAYWRLLRPRIERDAPDAAGLNRRAERLIGQRYVLETAIQNGRGKARVGDSLWLAEGPDLPAGAVVEVVAVDGSTLKVKAAG